MADLRDGQRHFLDIDLLDHDTLQLIINNAVEIKRDLKANIRPPMLEGKHLGLVFEKASTRTRASFEVAMHHLGGQTIVLTTSDSQLGRGEPVSDTAKVLSRYVDAIMLRTFKHETLLEMAEHASVPVINGLTDSSHPCQVMADLMTLEEHLGEISGKTVAWIGDCNNMATSWIHAAEKFKFNLNIGCPEELAPPSRQSEFVRFFMDPKKAVEGAHCVTTDTWISMGDAEDVKYKTDLLANGYQVNDELMSLADKKALFMHCLPAHRGEEVSASVIDGPHSVVWDEAENRLHVQKAILLWCFGII